MSGLVSGLQNRARRFESACDLKKRCIFIRYISFFTYICLIKKVHFT